MNKAESGNGGRQKSQSLNSKFQNAPWQAVTSDAQIKNYFMPLSAFHLPFLFFAPLVLLAARHFWFSALIRRVGTRAANPELKAERIAVSVRGSQMAQHYYPPPVCSRRRVDGSWRAKNNILNGGLLS